MKKSDRAITNKEKVKFTNKKIGIEMLLFLGVIVAVYLFFALISFDPADPGWSQTAWHEPIRNWCGMSGAYLSDIFLQFFGFIAYCLPILIVLFCLQAMRYFYCRNGEPINFLSLSMRIIGVLAFLFSATGFFALNIQDIEQFNAGGILGDIVADEVLPFLGLLGASIILFSICLVCITLLTGLSWLFIAEKIGICVVFISTPIIAFIVNIFEKNPRTIDPRHADDSDNEIESQLAINLDETMQKEPSLTVNMSAQSTDFVSDGEMGDHNLAPVLISTATLDNELTKTSEDIQVEAGSEVEISQPQPQPIITSIESSAEELYNKTDIIQKFDQVLSEFNSPIVDITIDENNPPPKLLNSHQSDVHHEFTINPDYYSPISEATATTETSLQLSTPDVLSVVAEEDIIKLVEVDDGIIAPVGSYGINPQLSSVNSVIPLINSQEQQNLQPYVAPYDEVKTDVYIQSVEPLQESVQQSIPQIDAALMQTFTPVQEVEDEDEPPFSEITKENIHDSLIHPLLQKSVVPMQKPTTPLPSLDLLTTPPINQVEIDHEALKATAQLIEKSLSDFRVKARVVDYLPGPVITRFEIELAPGVKASRISTLDRDLARSLSMPSVRVVEVIPGKPYVGIELPNKHRQTVYFREVLDSPQFIEATSPLTMVLGKDIAGQSVVADLAKMPHLLVAGTTGSGKSVGVNAMILSFLYKSQPEDVRFIMIDPKMLELSVYEGIPHLLTDVVTDMKDAANALNWCVNEMERRYRLMSALGVRNIAGYNDKIKLAQEMGRPIPDPLWRPGDSMDIDIPMLEKLPYIVVLVDEFADLIMAVGKKIEELIARLAQKARAAGIHLVLATQRPSVDVITGLIKANIPTRIAFTVSSKIDSRTILDQMGAESLLGMGDMLYLAPNSSIPIRVHGAFVRDEEVHSVVQDWKARGIPTQYVQNITSASGDGSDGDGFDNGEEELDPLFDQVVAFVVDKRRASISGVQRQFRIGYNRAARIVEQMEMQGVVSAPSHNGNREVLAPPSVQDY